MRSKIAFICSWLFLLNSLVFAADIQKNSVRKHIPTQEQIDYSYPWFDPTPRIYDVSTSPENPQLYLGELIRDEWQGEEYPLELYVKVDELTQGLTSEYDKLVTLANWVKRSKVATNATYILRPPSIADVWRSPSGDCDEAVFELVAMCRVAGIPAMAFDTWNRWHTAVRAYIDGRWVIADATPTPTDNNTSSARIYEPDNPQVIAAFQERPVYTFRNVAIPGGGFVDYFTLYSYEVIIGEREKYKNIGLDLAKVAFPVTNEFLYFDPATHIISTSGSVNQRISIRYRIDGQDDLCLNNRGSSYANSMRFITPGFHWRTVGYDRSSSWVMDVYMRGYVVTSLPTCGGFRVIYHLTNNDLNSPTDTQSLAYAEVQLFSGGDFVVVRPQDLQPMPGVDMYYFRALVETLQKLPTYEQLGGRR